MTLKEQAALAAVELVESGMLLGLGTGSTAALVVTEIGRRLRTGRLKDLCCIATSDVTARQAHEEGIPLTSFERVSALDLTIDGADEVDPSWNLIKGAGGALLREKIVAQASKLEAIVVDESKLVRRLGERMKLPLEVIPLGWQTHDALLRSLGGIPELRLNADGTPFMTDQGNYTVDVDFRSDAGLAALAKPHEVQARLLERAGIVETGLFLGLTSILIVAARDGVRVEHRV